ncbi:hypothetical protein FOCC_FOCC001136 [Frankliniella occidentalis]|nr:hypothetical protein FOCC_FOCC001136 [Frankliniella occidentalis]
MIAKMAGLKEQLQKEGWFLSDDGIKQLTDDGKITNIQTIIKKALDVDLREIAAPGFPEEVGRCMIEGIPGGLVVQLQKARNVSAPKANEESGAAPRMLKLTLTDGHSTCHAVEMSRIPALTFNTPPGTKILLKSHPGEENIPVSSNFLLLNANRAEILGGKVTHMYEKWDLNRSLAKHKRGGGEDGGPPPWTAFGQKIVRSHPSDRNFKSLQDKDKQNTEAFNPEFEAQRKDAIAEAGKGGARKVFGGGNRQLLDHNVQQIVDMGYSIEQADNALKMSRNNVDRALKILQRQSDGPKSTEAKKPEKDVPDTRTRDNPRESGQESGRATGKGNNRERGKGRGHDDEVGGSAPAKPSGRLSLFDFLEDKLPFEEKEKLQAASMRGHQERGGRGGGGGRGAANGRGPPEREYRGGNAERGGRGGGRGRGGGTGGGNDRRQDRSYRDENRPNNDKGFKDRKDNPRSKDQPNSQGRKDGSANGKNTSKTKDKDKGGDSKAPRFQNQSTRPPLQHESTRYLGHTPSNAVSTNSSLGQGVPDWQASLSSKVEMMSMIDCDNTPDDDPLFNNPSWANSQRDFDGLQSRNHPQSAPRQQYQQMQQQQHHQQHHQQQQQYSRPIDNGRNTNQGIQKPNQSNFRQHIDNRNSPFENDMLGSKGGLQGGSRNAPNNPALPKIPDFPYKENLHMSSSLMNGGYPSNNTTISNNNPNNTRNVGNPKNSGISRNMQGGRTDSPQHLNPEDSDGPGVYWAWKLGDQCLARYWEDERYYEAVVTGIAARTLVVRFVDYGNHEEVLKQDTIPVTKSSFFEPLRNALNNGCPPSSLPADQYFNLGNANIESPGNSSGKPFKSMNSVNSHTSYESNGIPFSGL